MSICRRRSRCAGSSLRTGVFFGVSRSGLRSRSWRVMPARLAAVSSSAIYLCSPASPLRPKRACFASFTVGLLQLTDALSQRNIGILRTGMVPAFRVSDASHRDVVYPSQASAGRFVSRCQSTPAVSQANCSADIFQTASLSRGQVKCPWNRQREQSQTPLLSNSSTFMRVRSLWVKQRRPRCTGPVSAEA